MGFLFDFRDYATAFYVIKKFCHSEMLLFFFLCLSADKNPKQHVPLQEYSDNLKEISRFLISAGVAADRIIFITPPPIHEPAWEKECILKGEAESQASSFFFFEHLTPQT